MKFLTTIGEGAAVVDVETEAAEIDRYDAAMDREYTETVYDVVAVWLGGVDIIDALTLDQLETLHYEANNAVR